MSTTTTRRRTTKRATFRRSAAQSAVAFDYSLIAIVATMLALGLVMVYSASFVQALREYNSPAHFFIKQALWIGLGIIAMTSMAVIPYRFWQKWAILVMVATLLALLAVLIFGDVRYGARRTLFNGHIQPSELAKLGVVIYVAAWVASKGKQITDVQMGLLPFAILMGLVAGLVMLEHSFSITIIILITSVTIFFLGGGDVKQLGITITIGTLVLALLIWQSYGATRVQNWWQTILDPSQAPYDVSKAMEIIRMGGGIGTRPENWLQKSSVPLLWSDYLFANVGADLRFPGTLLVVGLFAALGYRGLGIALNAPDRFSGLVAIGITTWILTQAAIHMSVSLALIPATGIPLPFMSYGGSAMIACMAAIGLLLNISRASPEKKAPYANFAFGWGNRRSRLPDSGGSRRSKTKQPSSRTKSSVKRKTSSRQSRKTGKSRLQSSKTRRKTTGRRS